MGPHESIIHQRNPYLVFFSVTLLIKVDYMSSLPGGVESIIAGSSPVGNVVGNPVADDPQHLDIRQVALNTCLKELLGQDGRRKRNQSGDDMALEAALVEVGEADALFIEGLRNMSYYSQSEISFKLFSEAEEKGCNHPVLYYFLGEYFRSGKVGTARDIAKAVHYYDMAIKGKQTSIHDFKTALPKCIDIFAQKPISLEAPVIILTCA